MGWPCREADEAVRLLHRARILLDGYNPAYGTGENKFGAAGVMTTEQGNTAILRAAAVLANAAVTMLADEIEYRERTCTDEELQAMVEMVDGQGEDVPQAPPAPDTTSGGEVRQERQAPSHPPKRPYRKRAKQEEPEPALASAEPAPPGHFERTADGMKWVQGNVTPEDVQE